MPALDVSSAATRDARAAVTTASGTAVAAHVPFALSPHSTKWDDVRTGATGPQWSDVARKARATDFVVLVMPTSALGDEAVVSDRDATLEGARFASGAAEATPLLRRVSIGDADLLEPELLVPGSVDLAAVTLIGVPNDKMRDQVKQLLADAGGVMPRVAVYPPWFRPHRDRRRGLTRPSRHARVAANAGLWQNRLVQHFDSLRAQLGSLPGSA